MPGWRVPVEVPKKQRCVTKFPAVFAVTGSTLQQVDPLSEHAVRWQLALVVPRLGVIALRLRLRVVIPSV